MQIVPFLWLPELTDSDFTNGGHSGSGHHVWHMLTSLLVHTFVKPAGREEEVLDWFTEAGREEVLNW